VLWDLRPEGITGSKMEKACDLCHITLNKNAGAPWPECILSAF
jgi:glycine hydroxymethyltransferase